MSKAVSVITLIGQGADIADAIDVLKKNDKIEEDVITISFPNGKEQDFILEAAEMAAGALTKLQ